MLDGLGLSHVSLHKMKQKNMIKKENKSESTYKLQLL